METQSDAWIALKHESDIRRTGLLINSKLETD